jgi:outer membrane lipoprotein SlyB
MMSRRFLPIGLAAVLLVGGQAPAQQPPTTRVRGTIESFDGKVLDVKARDGANVRIKLADGARITAITRMKPEDIKQGSYIGVAGIPEADGSQRALSINIFPEAARGLGDGFRPYDLQPNSTMTNAAVSEMVQANDGKTLMVKYKDGEKKIIVTPQTQVSTFGPGSRDDLKAGVKVIVNATKLDDGSLESKGMQYGRDGLQPM